MHHRKVRYAAYISYYCLMRNVQKVRPIRGTIWLLISAFLTKVTSQNERSLSRLVKKIELSIDGRHVDIEFISGRRLYNVDISSLALNDAQRLNRFYDMHAAGNWQLIRDFVPVDLRSLQNGLEETVFIAKRNTCVPDRLLFNNVVRGRYIDLRRQLRVDEVDGSVAPNIVDVQVEMANEQ